MTNPDGVEWVTLQEAARRFGVSVRTIQARIASDRLITRRDGRRVFVKIPLHEDFANLHENFMKTSRSTSPSQDVLIEQLQRENERLTEQLAAKDRQIEQHQIAEAELRRLLLQSQTALTETQAQKAIEPPETPRHWWSFWRRNKR